MLPNSRLPGARLPDPSDRWRSRATCFRPRVLDSIVVELEKLKRDGALFAGQRQKVLAVVVAAPGDSCPGDAKGNLSSVHVAEHLVPPFESPQRVRRVLLGACGENYRTDPFPRSGSTIALM